MVLVFTQNANMSDDVSRELYLGANSKLAIIPFAPQSVIPLVFRLRVQNQLARSNRTNGSNRSLGIDLIAKGADRFLDQGADTFGEYVDLLLGRRVHRIQPVGAAHVVGLASFRRDVLDYG
jgi:hypothetical protein